tara:strand:+ start:1590 stop:2033 length:444 start_codon:yes stop_codon:yes gene_type:complete
MIISVKRFTSDNESTLSMMSIDEVFECFGLEDEYREVKVQGETRIPSGEYKVTLRNEGGMTKRYAEKYPDLHRGMLWLRDVPNFTYVYIHVGNQDDHTEGCILTGGGCDARQNAMKTTSSSLAYKALYSKVVDAAEAGTLTCVVTGD